jgi:membrane fusion protein (multidrug efflux system)
VAQVRARVNGVVLKRLFTEGSIVKQGQSLFQIDPEPYQAQLNAAQAAQGRAQANLTSAAAIVERYKPLVEANAVSKQEYTNAVAAQKQAEADVASAKANVQDRPDQFQLRQRVRADLRAASAARWSPKARWCPPARRPRWR